MVGRKSGELEVPGPLGLYVHIPFCAAICNYCNFNRGLFDADLKDRYVAALVEEISAGGSSAGSTLGLPERPRGGAAAGPGWEPGSAARRPSASGRRG